MTPSRSTLFTLESGQSGLGFYTTQRDAAANELPMLTRAQEALSEIQNETFTHSDPWLELLRGAIEDNRRKWQSPFSTAKALEMAGLKQREQITRADETRLAPLLRQLGFDKAKNPSTTEDGKRSRLWSPAQPAQPLHNLSGEGCAPPKRLQANDSQPTAQPAQPISSKKSKGGCEQAAEIATAPPAPVSAAKQVVQVVHPSLEPCGCNGFSPAQPQPEGVVQVVQVVRPRQVIDARLRELKPNADFSDWSDKDATEMLQSLEAAAARRAAAAGISIPDAT
jgi:hypothetical protein